MHLASPVVASDLGDVVMFGFLALLAIFASWLGPALLLALTKRTNREAAWIVLVWQALPALAFAGILFGARELLGAGWTLACAVLLLGPAAFYAKSAWDRLDEIPEPTQEISLPAPSVGAPQIPYVQLISFFAAIAVGRALASHYLLAWFEQDRSGVMSLAAGMQASGVALAILGAAAQWLVLRRAGVKWLWIAAVAVGALFTTALLTPLRTIMPGMFLKAWGPQILLSGIAALLPALTLPPRYVRRMFWPLAALGITAVQAAIWSAAWRGPGGLLRGCVVSACTGALAGAALGWIFSAWRPAASAAGTPANP